MINSLPIPNIILKEEKEIINVVQNINENNKKEQLNKLNNIIYKLYGLDQSDIDIIEKYLEKKIKKPFDISKKRVILSDVTRKDV